MTTSQTAAQPGLAGKADEDEPSPAWRGAIPVTTFTQDQVDRGLIFLDDFEALLQGRKLLPHWRLEQGINLRRVFLEPSTFDLTLWIQGSAAIPYLEDGELISTEAWKKAGAGATAQRSRSDE